MHDTTAELRPRGRPPPLAINTIPDFIQHLKTETPPELLPCVLINTTHLTSSILCLHISWSEFKNSQMCRTSAGPESHLKRPHAAYQVRNQLEKHPWSRTVNLWAGLSHTQLFGDRIAPTGAHGWMERPVASSVGSILRDKIGGTRLTCFKSSWFRVVLQTPLPLCDPVIPSTSVVVLGYGWVWFGSVSDLAWVGGWANGGGVAWVGGCRSCAVSQRWNI